MHIIVTLGTRWRESPVVLDIEAAVDDLPEFNPDAVFQAANRIEDEETDRAALAASWQRQLRHSIEVAQAPSMSVGDQFELCSDNGTYLGGWLCQPVGWSYIEPKVA